MIRRLPIVIIPCFALTFALNTAAHAQFAENTAVADVSIAGLNDEEATRRLKRELAPKLELKVALAAGPKLVYRQRKELGFSIDTAKILTAAKNNQLVPVSFKVDRDAAKKALASLEKIFNIEVVEAAPVKMGDEVQIRPSKAGKKFDVSTSAARLQILGEKNEATTRFALEAKTIEPKVKTEDLQGIDSVLDFYTTRFNRGIRGRTNNLRIATAAIDGMVLAPGQVFSLNKAVGQRTKARGYQEAIIFENGKQIRGLGGGVSQVTGTLFNAALEAGLPIVTYRTHSRPVAYLPVGRDATVAWGSFDMKFKNDTGAPIYISYKVRGSRLRATLFGKKTGRTTKIRVSSKKNGVRNISAGLYRVIYKDGKVQTDQKVGSSHYNWKADDQD